MRLHRPYIPLDVREKVIERQVRERHGFVPVTPSTKNKAVRIKALLHVLDPTVERWELQHRPALCNRVWNGLRYHPEANDPDFLVYLSEAEHDIETRVRGLHGQHSDLALLRKNKRILRKRQKIEWRDIGGGYKAGPVSTQIASLRDIMFPTKARRKFKWPKRKLQSRPFSRSR